MNGLLWLHQEQVSSVRFAHANVDRRRWHTFETFAFARGGRRAGVGAAEAASADAARMIMTSAEARTTHILLGAYLYGRISDIVSFGKWFDDFDPNASP